MTTEAPKKEDKVVAAKRKTFPELLEDVNTQKLFRDMLGKDARSFQQNMLTVYNGGLQACDPDSVVASCAISASINLSILPSLGQSCVVPYKDGDRLVAQWQIMTRGIIALAMRSEQYKKINLARVYDGQLVENDEFKGTVTLNAKAKKSDRVQGYYFFFELLNGFTRESYWSAKKCIEHGLRFSKSFQKGSGKWAEDPEFTKAGSVKKWLDGKEHFLTEGSGADAMSSKTAVKNDLTKWGPLETRIREIISLDQAVVDPDGSKRYIDTTAEPAGEAKTYTAPPMNKPGEGPFPVEKIAWARAAAEKQGVPVEQFDAWIAQQPGGDFEKAKAATVAWKAVAAKTIKAVDAFAVKKEEEPEGQEAEFLVSGAATSTFNDEPAYVIRDSEETPVKFFTDSEDIYKAAQAAQKAKKKLHVRYIEKSAGKNVFRWVVAVV